MRAVRKKENFFRQKKHKTATGEGEKKDLTRGKDETGCIPADPKN